MINNIMKFLDLEDDDLELLSVEIIDDTKVIEVVQKIKNIQCPICGSKLYSKGIEKRTLNHPIMQDGYKVKIILRQRRLKCSSPFCTYHGNQENHIAFKGKQHTIQADLILMDLFKDLRITARQIAERCQISDTSAYYTFMSFATFERLPMPNVLAVDEVYIDIDTKQKYAVILMDWETGEIVDVICSRWNTVTEKYFYKIPYKERRNVKYLISDMYDPYIKFKDKYFPNAVSVTDSFHVIANINKKLVQYCNKLKHSYDDDSIEYYLLFKYSWLMTVDDRPPYKYSSKQKYNKKFKKKVTMAHIRNRFFEINPNLMVMKKLRDKYYKFNEFKTPDGKIKDKDMVKNEMDELIIEYASSEFDIFVEVAGTLKKYEEYIINSFIELEGINRRLSNGPMESLNRKPKDYKRIARGFSNFEYLKARLIWGTRKNVSINGSPKSTKSIRAKNATNKERGTYNKSK